MCKCGYLRKEDSYETASIKHPAHQRGATQVPAHPCTVAMHEGEPLLHHRGRYRLVYRTADPMPQRSHRQQR